MASGYTSFEVLIDNDDGTTTPVLSQPITVYDVTNDVALDDLASDANGHVASGTLDVDAGTIVRFSAALADGRCGFKEEVTV
jgi:hypothetical protein